ncbi:TVP38/TMEM64 family protein [Salinigranum sp.]|uniref:TVP38/TMEM64 family protein n=1 Tax=Salinigranum sp. TaxID=1966351 RepID=UPI003568C301
MNSRRRRLLGLAVLGLLGVVGAVTLSPRELFVRLATVDVWLFALVFVPLLVVRAFILVPVTLVTVFVGYRFGLVVGLPLALAATVVTCVPPYLVARHAPDSGLFGTVGDWGARTVDHVGGLRGTTAARLSPTPADVVSYAAGVSGVPLRSFVVGTLLGELPWATGYVLVGSALGRVVYDVDVDVRYLVAAGVVAVLLVARPLYRLARTAVGEGD